MKKKSFAKSNFTEKFRNEKIEDNKLNFLLGGDENGGEGGTGDPWNP
jgi:hypothetical protein